MKKLMIATLLVASSAFAGAKSSVPTVNFPGAVVPLNNTCLNNNGDLQTTFAVQLYKLVRTGEKTEYVATEKKVLTTSVDYTRTVCVRYGKNDCAAYETVSKSYPLSYTVDLYKVVHGSERSVETKVGKESFNVPNCN